MSTPEKPRTEMAEQNSPADWLPPGWTSQVSVRKNGKRDTCYTDPSNELKFFSKPEVLRYLSSIETNSSKFNGKRKGSRSRKLSAINSPAVAERLQLADSTANERMTRHQSSKLIGELKDDKTLESCTGREGTSVSASCSNLTEATDLEQREKIDPITVSHSEKLPENGLENPLNKRKQLRLNEKNNRKKPDLPRRSSKRLAGIEVGPIPEIKTNNRPRQVSSRRLDDEAEASNKAENSRDSAAPEECAEKRENKADDKKADEDRESPLDFCLKDLWTDPCIEFAIKTLTDAIPIGDLEKMEENPRSSSIELPFGDSWGDPCIEFAVKTLTGAIPVVDLGIQDYIQQQLNSSSSEITKQEDQDSKFSNVGFH